MRNYRPGNITDSPRIVKFPRKDNKSTFFCVTAVVSTGLSDKRGKTISPATL